MADDFVAACMQLFQCIGEILCDAAVGVDGPFDAVAGEDIHDAPDTGFPAILAIGERRIIRFAFAAAVLRAFFKCFERNEETNRNFGVIGPLNGRKSHDSSLSCLLVWRTEERTE